MKVAKRILKILIVLAVLIAVSVGILIAFDKIFHTNSFDELKLAISHIISYPQAQPSVLSDTTPLTASLKTKTITVLASTTAVTLITNKEVTIDPNNRTDLLFVKQDIASDTDDTEFWYALEIKNIGVGEASVSAIVKDKSGNSQTLTLDITRQGYSLPSDLTSIDPWPNSTYTADGDNLKAQVNKEHKLINDYVPVDLKNLYSDYQLYTNTATILLRKEPADHLANMLTDLRNATGKNAVIASGYRSYNDQYKLYAGYVRDLGQDATDQVSARPGFSEHQLGTAVDFIDQDSGLTLTNDFDKDAAGKWILANSYKYGYIQSYPDGKEETTGYAYEAWHYRYIGIDNATQVHNSGLTLKEWLEQNP